MAKMTEKQKRFCDEYLIDPNATQAAIKAGYSKKTAKEQGSRLLTNVNIKAYIGERLETIKSKKIADAEEVIEYLTSVLRGEGYEEMVVVEGCGEGVSRATTVTRDICPKDRLKAAEMLGKRYGLFTDKVDVGGAVPVVIAGDDSLED